MPERTARVRLQVSDEQGRSLPCRVDLSREDGSRPVGEDGPLSHWIEGAAEIEVRPGKTTFRVRHGFQYGAAEETFELAAGQRREWEARLARRVDLRSRGWVSGENHAHVIHDPSGDPKLTIAYGARLARCEGLDYVQFCPNWDRTGRWYAVEELNRQCAAASGEGLAVSWNLEAPKTYMSEDDGGVKGNLFCFGHGWTLGLKDHLGAQDFWFTGPNYPILQEVHRQGAVVGCAHPVRFWFSHGHFVSNMNQELPFDMVSGAAYDALDVLNDGPECFALSEAVWYGLLNLGYKIAGTANSDACLERHSVLGRLRTYTRIPGPFSWAALAEALRAGRNFATSGPLVLFETDGEGPGHEFPADGRPRNARIEAWPAPGEELESVQLLRNGEPFATAELPPRISGTDQPSGLSPNSAVTMERQVAERGFAYYTARVVSRRRSESPAGPFQVAVANPVYFLPDGFHRPEPAVARVRVEIADSAGKPLDGQVLVVDGGQELARHEAKGGRCEFECPATAFVTASAPGCQPQRQGLLLGCEPLREYVRTATPAWPSLCSAWSLNQIRRMLREARLSFRLSGR